MRHEFKPESIRNLREVLDLTEHAFGEELDLSEDTIRRWEEGQLRPTADLLARVWGLADKYHLRVDFFHHGLVQRHRDTVLNWYLHTLNVVLRYVNSQDFAESCAANEPLPSTTTSQILCRTAKLLSAQRAFFVSLDEDDQLQIRQTHFEPGMRDFRMPSYSIGCLLRGSGVVLRGSSFYIRNIQEYTGPLEGTENWAKELDIKMAFYSAIIVRGVWVGALYFDGQEEGSTGVLDGEVLELLTGLIAAACNVALNHHESVDRMTIIRVMEECVLRIDQHLDKLFDPRHRRPMG